MLLKSIPARALLLWCSVSLIGCGVIASRTDEYKQSKEGKQLIVPENLKADRVTSSYPVPAIDSSRTLPAEYKLPTPPNATATFDSAPYLIETVDNQTWVLLYNAPGKVWPLLDQFWRSHGLRVTHENVSKGLMATEPLGNSSVSYQFISTLEQRQQHPLVIEGFAFQARLRQGVRRNTTELQIRTILPGYEPGSPLNWQNEAVNSRLELTLLDMVGEYITGDSSKDQYSLLANDIGGRSRIRISQDENGENYLKMDLGFERAWNAIGKALKKSDILVADIDRSAATYYVSYLSQDDMQHWYDFISSEEKLRKEHNIIIYLQQLKPGSVKVTVKLVNPDMDPEVKSQLLDLLMEHIS